MSYLRQYDIGIIGIALLRNWLVGNDKKAYKIIKELRAILNTNEDKVFKSNKLDVLNGYKKWSKTYDKTPNLLIEIENNTVKNILKSIPLGTALDVACGTGRHTRLLKDLGFDVTGMDLSIEMIKRARINNPDINFVQGDIEKIKFDNNSFNLVNSTLALTHLKKIDNAIKEFARITKIRGRIILSDIHPWITLLGGQAYFLDEEGNYNFIRNYVHWHNTYLKIFKQNNLKIITCEEPTVDKNHIELASVWFNLNKETIVEAFEGLPLALVWELEKF